MTTSSPGFQRVTPSPTFQTMPGGVGAADVVALLGVVAVAEHRDGLAERRPDVVEVHAGGHHADDHLEGAGLGDLDLLELEGVDRLALALLADDPGGHRLRQRARARSRSVATWLDVDCHVLRSSASVRSRSSGSADRTVRDGRTQSSQKRSRGYQPRWRAGSRQPPTPSPRRRRGDVDVAHQPTEVLAEEAGHEGEGQEDRRDRPSAASMVSFRRLETVSGRRPSAPESRSR